MSQRAAVAILGTGDTLHRAIAVAFADAGCPAIALGTLEPDQQQEYAVHSIANEIWAIGPEQYVGLLDAADALALDAFIGDAEQVVGDLTATIAVYEPPSDGATMLVQHGRSAGGTRIIVTNGDVVRSVEGGTSPEVLAPLVGEDGNTGSISQVDGNEQAVAAAVVHLVPGD